MKRMVLLGGGHAHVEVLRRLHLAPLSNVEAWVVTSSRCTAYSGMLPGLIAGHYVRKDIEIDVVRLAHLAGARIVLDRAVGIDAERHTVALAQSPELTYDWLSLDIGSIADVSPIRNANRIGFPVRPLDALLPALELVISKAQRAQIDVAIVGGGAGGVELCLALEHRVRVTLGVGRARFVIVTDASAVLPQFHGSVRKRVMRKLSERKVAVHLDSRVVAAEQGALLLDAGRSIAADVPIWVTGPAAQPWLRESGLALDERGFVAVDERLQSTSHPDVFAAGDVATMVRHPPPKSGVYAVRQGPILAINLRRAVEHKALQRFLPQRRSLQLISTGERAAIASWGKLAGEGAWVWRWKDWIDRRFVARYR